MKEQRKAWRSSGSVVAALLLWAWQPPWALGAEAATAPSATAEAPAREDRADQEGSRQAAGGDGDSPEIFVPTEEISEDFAVSFPVDI